MAAGLGVAVPFGAIAVLIVETSIRRGRWFGWAAGAGAATADLTYASLAALFGTALADVIAPVQVPIRWLSVVVLAAIAARGILGAVRRARAAPVEPGLERLDEATPRRTYLQFVALTIVNPATVVYFAALILGLPAVGAGSVEKLVFVVGAGAASLVWQLLIATGGSLLHHRVSPRTTELLSLAGYGIVLVIAANITRGLLAG